MGSRWGIPSRIMTSTASHTAGICSRVSVCTMIWPYTESWSLGSYTRVKRWWGPPTTDVVCTTPGCSRRNSAIAWVSSRVLRISVPWGSQISTKNIGVLDSGKNACFTDPKPITARTNMPTTIPTVIQRKRIAVATKPR